jgi:molybdopterin-guanine dinucleotide biosynthesis protein A
VGIVRDAVSAQGPLQALADGLAHLRGRGAGVAFAAACDLPLLTPPFVRAVLAALGDARGRVPRDAAGRPHPLAAVYRVILEPDLRAMLERGERAVRSVLSLSGVRALPAADLRRADPDLRSLLNVNTPGDLERALSLHASGTKGPGL